MSGELDIEEQLRGMIDAYPEDIFPTPPPERQAKDAAAAHVMRRLAVPMLTKALDEIERLRAFAEWVLSQSEPEARRTVTLTQILQRARAALGDTDEPTEA